MRGVTLPSWASGCGTAPGSPTGARPSSWTGWPRTSCCRTPKPYRSCGERWRSCWPSRTSEELLRLGAVGVALTTALWDHRGRDACLQRAAEAARASGFPAAAGHRPVDPVPRRADRRHPAAGGGLHRSGPRAAAGHRLPGRARGQRGLPGLGRGTPRPGRGGRRGDAAGRLRRCARLGRGRPCPPGSRRGPLPRRLPAAAAADRGPVPAGHTPGVPGLRGSRGPSRYVRTRRCRWWPG